MNGIAPKPHVTKEYHLASGGLIVGHDPKCWCLPQKVKLEKPRVH